MKRISLYTSEDAFSDVRRNKKTGIEASIRKWKRIINALEQVYVTMIGDCGLCYESEHCRLCSFTDDCGHEGSVFLNTTESLDDSITKAKKTLSRLEELKNES